MISDYKGSNPLIFFSYTKSDFYWSGQHADRFPFTDWKNGKDSLGWFEAYNDSKHDRRSKFFQANFSNLMDAYTGLLVILTAQFGLHDYSPGPALLALEGSEDGFENPIGGYLRVKLPKAIPFNERYSFRWEDIKNDPNPFDKIDFTKI